MSEGPAGKPSWTALVRYAEADQQGVVFNAHYLTYCDEAMTAYFTERDVDYAAIEASGRHTQLVHTELTWSSPARWGEVIEVHVVPEHRGRSSFRLRFDVLADGRLSCVVRTTYVMTNPEGTPITVPEELRPHLDAALDA